MTEQLGFWKENRRVFTEAEKGYIAGIIDGEGCVSLATRQGRYVTPTIQVANTNQELLMLFYAWFGGNIDIRKDTRPNRKQCNTWRIAGAKAKRLLEMVRPYLIVKRSVAEVVLSLPVRRTGARLYAEDFARNARALKLVRSLNKRGMEGKENAS